MTRWISIAAVMSLVACTPQLRQRLVGPGLASTVVGALVVANAPGARSCGGESMIGSGDPFPLGTPSPYDLCTADQHARQQAFAIGIPLVAIGIGLVMLAATASEPRKAPDTSGVLRQPQPR